MFWDDKDGDNLQARHLHLVFPAPMCPGIETVVISLDEPCIVSFEPDSVLLPNLSCIGGQSEGGEVWERLLEVIDAPVLADLCLQGFDDIPAPVFQKTTLKKIELNGGARVPTSIPDDIRNLVNLEYFKLWGAELSYLSPELFRLPQIRKISLYRLKYKPTPEVVAAAEAFVAAGGCLDQPYGEGPLKLGKAAASEGSSDSAPPDPQVKTEAAAGDETAALEIVPFEADPRVLVLTYAADWHGQSGDLFWEAVKGFRSRCNSGEAPLPAGVIGAVFDAHASGMDIRVEIQFSAILALWKFFTQRRITFVISGPSESVINIFEFMRIWFIPIADSIAEAAGLCGQIGRALEDKDSESLERILGSHREAFLGRNGRTPSSREIPLSALADGYLREWGKRPVIAVEGEASCLIDQAATYVFADKPNPALTRLIISAKESSVLLEGSRLELPNLEEITVLQNASLAIFASIAAKLVAPKLRQVEFEALENVEFPQSLGLLKSASVVAFNGCSISDGGSFPSWNATELHFWRSKLPRIPDGIQNAHSLQTLTFLDCEIASFDPKILFLPNLKDVLIPFEIPTSPELLKAIAGFRARGGRLTQGPPPDLFGRDCR